VADGRAIGAPILVKNTPHQIVGSWKDVPLQDQDRGRSAWNLRAVLQNPAAGGLAAGDPRRRRSAAMLPALIREVNRATRTSRSPKP